jgi:hypothetical protein
MPMLCCGWEPPLHVLLDWTATSTLPEHAQRHAKPALCLLSSRAPAKLALCLLSSRCAFCGQAMGENLHDDVEGENLDAKTRLVGGIWPPFLPANLAFSGEQAVDWANLRVGWAGLGWLLMRVGSRSGLGWLGLAADVGGLWKWVGLAVRVPGCDGVPSKGRGYWELLLLLLEQKREEKGSAVSCLLQTCCRGAAVQGAGAVGG